MDKSHYNNLLKDHNCRVVFIKKNGEHRTMICSLQSSALEEVSSHKATASTVDAPDHQARVIDVEKKAWRSFTVDSIISFEVI